MTLPPPLPTPRKSGRASRTLLRLCGLICLTFGGFLCLASGFLLLATGPGLDGLMRSEQNTLGDDRSSYWLEADRKYESLDRPHRREARLSRLKEEFLAESLLRLDPDVYRSLPFWTSLRYTLWARFLLAGIMAMAGLWVCFRKRRAWKILMVVFPALVVCGGIEAINMNQNLAPFLDALRIDALVVRQDLVDEVGAEGFWTDADLRFLEPWEGSSGLGMAWLVLTGSLPVILALGMGLPVVQRGLTQPEDSVEMTT